MPRQRKVPAVLVAATIRENNKLAALPNDTARLGYIYICLGAAKLLKPIPGQFTSRSHFREIAGRFAPYLKHYLATGLMEEAPRLCDRCEAKWTATPPPKGALVTHDWHEHQYDPFHAERQAAYEARKAGKAGLPTEPESDVEPDAQSDGVSDGQSDARTDAETDGRTDANLTADSRAKARIPVRDHAPDRVGMRASELRTLNSERREGDSSQVPSSVVAHEAEEPDAKNGASSTSLLDAWATFAGSSWLPFIAAWRDRGFRLPPSQEQRDTLLEVVDARPNDVGRWVSDAPKGATTFQIVSHVLERWHEVRATAGAQASAEDLEQTHRATRRGGTTSGLERAL